MTLGRNILTTLSTRVLLLGVALVSSMVLARTLGPQGRGLFALVLLLPEFVKCLGLLGFEQANAVYAGLEPGKRQALVWHSAWMAIVVGSIAALGGTAYVALGLPGMQTKLTAPLWLFLIPLAMVPARILMEYWLAVLRGMNRIFVLNIIELTTRIASLALIVVCVVGLHAGVAGAVSADAMALAILVGVLGGLLAYFGALGRPTFDLVLWKRTAGFALPAHFASVMSYLNYRMDQFVIAVLLPPEQLAFYVIAVDIAERLWIIPGAVSTALLPHLTNSPKRDPALAAVIARHVMLWTAVACVGVFVVAGVAIDFLFSSAFAPAAAPLRWLLPGILTLTVGKVLVAELLAREKIRFTIWLSIIAVATNLSANFVLIPAMGIAGAGLASSLSYSIVSLVVVAYFVRETGVSVWLLFPQPSDLLVYAAFLQRFRRIPAVAAPDPVAAS